MTQNQPGLRRRLEGAAINLLGGPLINSLLRTLRWTVDGLDYYNATLGGGVPAMAVLWHGRLLPIAYYHRHTGVGTLISQHRDGDYIARVAGGWGYKIVRGSSSRGGSEALVGIVDLIRSGMGVAITPDGPRGPRQEMKFGAIRAAQLTGQPILPVSAAATSSWWFESWDRFLVPKPFSHVHIIFGEPIMVPADAGPDELEELRLLVQNRLNALTDEADERVR